MYINLLNLVVTLFWTCCDLDRNHARAIVHRRDVSAAVWGAVHSVPAALSPSLVRCLSGPLPPYGTERKQADVSSGASGKNVSCARHCPSCGGYFV